MKNINPYIRFATDEENFFDVLGPDLRREYLGIDSRNQVSWHEIFHDILTYFPSLFMRFASICTGLLLDLSGFLHEKLPRPAALLIDLIISVPLAAFGLVFALSSAASVLSHIVIKVPQLVLMPIGAILLMMIFGPDKDLVDLLTWPYRFCAAAMYSHASRITSFMNKTPTGTLYMGAAMLLLGIVAASFPPTLGLGLLLYWLGIGCMVTGIASVRKSDQPLLSSIIQAFTGANQDATHVPDASSTQEGSAPATRPQNSAVPGKETGTDILWRVVPSNDKGPPH